MLGGIIFFVRQLPKVSIFYFLLTKVGLAHYSLLLLIPALALDVIDYTSYFD